MWHLYVIRLPVNDYVIAYVGVTKNEAATRLSSHRYAPLLIGDAIRACGHENVIFEIIESGARDFIYQREQEAIATFKTRVPFGYNVAAGGFGGRDPLPGTRAKIGAANAIALRGRTIPAETCARMAAARRGKKRSPSFSEKLAERNRIRRGIPWSPARRLAQKPRDPAQRKTKRIASNRALQIGAHAVALLSFGS